MDNSVLTQVDESRHNLFEILSDLIQFELPLFFEQYRQVLPGKFSDQDNFSASLNVVFEFNDIFVFEFLQDVDFLLQALFVFATLAFQRYVL